MNVLKEPMIADNFEVTSETSDKSVFSIPHVQESQKSPSPGFITDDVQIIDLGPSILTKSQQMYLPFKRLIDIIGAFLALILFSPIILFTAIAIKIDSRGAVFFRQVRVGQNMKPFTMFKFRSMVNDADTMKDKLTHLNESEGPFFKIKDDPRVTKVGRFIRKFSIDELPQFANVLLGHMSLVGPRPPLYREVALYTPEQLKNLGIKPGITGYWQVGGRNASTTSRIQLDTQYIAEFNLAIDMMLLLKTPVAVFKRRGAS